MSRNDHLDHLIADMLGDIGLLHKEVILLKDEALPAIITEAQTQLEGIVGVLVKAAKQYETALNQVTAKTVSTAKADIRGSADYAKNDAISEIRQAVREAVTHPVGELVSELNSAVNRANEQQSRTFQHTVIAAVIGGVVAGSVVLGGAYFFMKDAAVPITTQSDEVAQPRPNKKGSKNG